MELTDTKKDIAKTVYNLKRINHEALTEPEKLIKQSENIYHNQIEDITDEIVANKNIKIMLVAGPSSSGKTTTSNLITQYLEKQGIHSIVISLDDFFVNRDQSPLLPDGSHDFENIKCIDIAYLNKFVNDIIETGKAMMPHYNFVSGEREKEYTPITLKENTILVFEGIHALNPQLITCHKENQYKIYICLNSNFQFDKKIVPARDVRLMRRMFRDYYTRGYSFTATISAWNNVLAGEDIYIKPYKNTSDFLIDSTHMYELLIYSKYLAPLMEPYKSNPIINKLLGYLQLCEKLDKKFIPYDSLLWEFVVKKDETNSK